MVRVILALKRVERDWEVRVSVIGPAARGVPSLIWRAWVKAGVISSTWWVIMMTVRSGRCCMS